MFVKVTRLPDRNKQLYNLEDIHYVDELHLNGRPTERVVGSTIYFKSGRSVEVAEDVDTLLKILSDS